MLDVQNIVKTFNAGTVNEKIALRGVSLHLNPGKVHNLLKNERIEKLCSVKLR